MNKGLGYADIRSIFENYKIGEKYSQHKSKEKYLKHNIDKAKEFSNLTEEEMQDPLFISNSIQKNEKNKYQLNVLNYQEYMTKKHKLKYLEKESTFFKYNDKCYETCTKEYLNHLCQNELNNHRGLFTIPVFHNFIHYGIGANLVGSDKAYDDQVRYLTLQNGLYDLIKYQLIPHSPTIFTTNLLPYDYNPDAECLRFLQYLNEIFMGDVETIDFIQEAVGYAFYKAMPIPAIFFLIGEGSNGKSVFTETLTNLCGPENASSISLNLLSKEYYLLDLFGKMINVSSETPKNRLINTDLVKAVVAGDWVAGREPYKGPCKFKPFAKHFLAMNEIPTIEDTSHGMWRRVYIIEFPKKFSEDEMDVFLIDKLKNELSGIFNWAIEGYKRLRERNFKFKEGRLMKASKQNYKNQSNSVLSFASEYFTNGDPVKDSVKFKEIYDLYGKNCESDRVKEIEKKTVFRTILENQGYKIDYSSMHNNQLRIFGVKIKYEGNLELAA